MSFNYVQKKAICLAFSWMKRNTQTHTQIWSAATSIVNDFFLCACACRLHQNQHGSVLYISHPTSIHIQSMQRHHHHHHQHQRKFHIIFWIILKCKFRHTIRHWINNNNNSNGKRTTKNRNVREAQSSVRVWVCVWGFIWMGTKSWSGKKAKLNQQPLPSN